MFPGQQLLGSFPSRGRSPSGHREASAQKGAGVSSATGPSSRGCHGWESRDGPCSYQQPPSQARVRNTRLHATGRRMLAAWPHTSFSSSILKQSPQPRDAPPPRICIFCLGGWKHMCSLNGTTQARDRLAKNCFREEETEAKTVSSEAVPKGVSCREPHSQPAHGIQKADGY
ncbi:UNVERIFIED_CONTAM: hypothetical protein K2H54_006775 [Gekko kuhli]